MNTVLLTGANGENGDKKTPPSVSSVASCSNSDDPVIATLKTRYFQLLMDEKFPHTPKITLEADNVEHAIRELQRRPIQPLSVTLSETLSGPS